jgi:N-acetylneuraminic acid mutarotase
MLARLLGLGYVVAMAGLVVPAGSSAARGAPRASTVGPAWSIATSLPALRQYPAVAAGHDGNIYVFGGEEATKLDTNTTLIYHPGSGTWTQGTNMPTTREQAQAVTLPDGRIAVLGGYAYATNTWFSTVEVYTPWTNRWATAVPMQVPRADFAAVLGKDRRIYAIGGTNNGASEPLSSVEAYNPRRRAWTYVYSLPQATQGLAAAVAPNGTITVIGGFNPTAGSGAAYYNNVWLYSARTGWGSGAPMPTAREDLSAATGPDGQIWAIGGFNNGFLSTVEAYNPATNSWSSGPPTPAAVCCLGAVTVPTRQIYAVGGSAGLPVPVLTFTALAHSIRASTGRGSRARRAR